LLGYVTLSCELMNSKPGRERLWLGFPPAADRDAISNQFQAPEFQRPFCLLSIWFVLRGFELFPQFCREIFFSLLSFIVDNGTCSCISFGMLSPSLSLSPCIFHFPFPCLRQLINFLSFYCNANSRLTGFRRLQSRTHKITK